MAKDIIQNIIFPDTDELKEHSALYYRGGHGVAVKQEDRTGLGFPRYNYIEFNTYFNGFSNEKWRTYTDISNVALSLTVCGDFVLKLLEISLVSNRPQVKVYSEQAYHLQTAEEITVDLKQSDARMLAFGIETLSDCIIYGGYYTGEFESDNNTKLAISSTTCHKEEYITRNVRLLYDELLKSDDEIARNLYIHVVDNGRSLTEDDFPRSSHIFLHPNKNTGGSGGYARGMIECMHQAEDITNVLLMDDDVNVQPESIRKTYYLLKHLKEEYRGCFVSGAMLYMEDVHIQREDIGMVNDKGLFVSVKGREFNHELLADNLYNEDHFPIEESRTYAAWWYCSIPMSAIHKNGLPLPLFVRGDDEEYSLRCKPGFITMNGICVWHMGFAGKFNVAMDYYQVNRNILIDHAISGVMDYAGLINKAMEDFIVALIRLDYDSAELCLRAIEDYQKGPEFILEDHGEEIMKANNKLVHEMKPLEAMGDPDVGLGDPYDDGYYTLKHRLISKITRNGHRLWFGTYKKINSIPYNKVWSPERTYMRGKLVAVNVDNRTGYILTRDSARYRKLMSRFKTAIRTYKSSNDKLIQEYRRYQQTMYSEEFWRKYLEI